MKSHMLRMPRTASLTIKRAAIMKPAVSVYVRITGGNVLEGQSRPKREVIAERLHELEMPLREAPIKARTNDTAVYPGD